MIPVSHDAGGFLELRRQNPALRLYGSPSSREHVIRSSPNRSAPIPVFTPVRPFPTGSSLDGAQDAASNCRGASMRGGGLSKTIRRRLRSIRGGRRPWVSTAQRRRRGERHSRAAPFPVRPLPHTLSDREKGETVLGVGCFAFGDRLRHRTFQIDAWRPGCHSAQIIEGGHIEP